MLAMNSTQPLNSSILERSPNVDRYGFDLMRARIDQVRNNLLKVTLQNSSERFSPSDDFGHHHTRRASSPGTSAHWLNRGRKSRLRRPSVSDSNREPLLSAPTLSIAPSDSRSTEEKGVGEECWRDVALSPPNATTPLTDTEHREYNTAEFNHTPIEMEEGKPSFFSRLWCRCKC